MKRIRIAILDDRELELAGLLVASGLSPSTARVIVCLMVRRDLMTREIAASTSMTSASVSVALRKLQGYGMLLSENSYSGRKSDRRYHLAGDWGHILAMIEKRELERYSGYTSKVDQARSEIKEKYGHAMARPDKPRKVVRPGREEAV